MYENSQWYSIFQNFATASHADDEDTFECSHGDDLDNLADLDLGTRSHSECEEEKIELDQQEIDDLPGLVVSVSTAINIKHQIINLINKRRSKEKVPQTFHKFV